MNDITVDENEMCVANTGGGHRENAHNMRQYTQRVGT